MMDIDGLVAKAKKMLDEANINYDKRHKFYVVDKVKNSTKCYGACYQSPKRIEILSDLLETKEEYVLSVIVHELIHTCDGCQNHTKSGFLSVAKIFNDKWVGTGEIVPITAKATPEIISAVNEVRLRKNPDNYNYKVVCLGCGACKLYKYPSKVVQMVSHYHCNKCGSQLVAYRKVVKGDKIEWELMD